MSIADIETRRTRRWATAACAALLVCGLAACAPEPPVGQGGKDADQGQSESNWSQPGSGAEAVPRETELPESFPIEQFPLPEGAVVYETGERDPGVWFVVLLADDEAASVGLWDEVIRLGGFQISDEIETTEGGQAATLTSATLRVSALTIPQDDGTVQLSYGLTRIA